MTSFWLLSRKLLGRFWWNFVCCLGYTFHCCHCILQLFGGYDVISGLKFLLLYWKLLGWFCINFISCIIQSIASWILVPLWTWRPWWQPFILWMGYKFHCCHYILAQNGECKPPNEHFLESSELCILQSIGSILMKFCTLAGLYRTYMLDVWTYVSDVCAGCMDVCVGRMCRPYGRICRPYGRLCRTYGCMCWTDIILWIIEINWKFFFLLY